MEERFIHVRRTARYHMLGTPEASRELWVVVHGYGHLARYFLNGFKGLEEGRCIIAPEGLSRFYLDETHSRVGATWMTREDRLHEIDDHVGYLDAVTKEVARTVMPGAAISVLGFSQGVATAARWADRGTTSISRLVLWGGGLPPELETGRMAEQWAGTRIDLVHGEKDPLVGNDVFVKNERILIKAGLKPHTHRFDGAHVLEPVLLERLITAR